MPRKPAAPKSDGPQISQEDVYEFLLESLSLSREHLANLVARGLSEEEVAQFGYKTFPMRRKEVVKALEEKFGIDELIRAAVPGLWRNTSGDLEIAGKSGIAIPVRNSEGRVTGIKIRVDKPINSSRKYLLLSSNPTPDKKTGEVKYPFGASAKISVHWPLVKPKKIRRLRVTEGELKADIATSLTDVYTISLPGVGMWKMAIEVIKLLKPEEVLLAYDSDKEVANSTYDAPGTDGGATEEHLVGKALSALYLAVKNEAGSLGIKTVGIEHWPAEAGKGIDDVLINGASDQIMVLKDDDADAFAHVMLAEGMPDGWVYVIGVKRFYHMDGTSELDKEQYADRFSHMEKGNPAANALRNPALPKVDFPIYMPNKPVIYEAGGKKFFNTWRRGTLEAKEGGSLKPFHDHCAYILPNEDERNIFLDWLAFNVQNPGVKILWAVLMQGVEGTGKSYFGWLMRMMLGTNNISMPSNEMIHEIYTAWAKSCQLVVIEEIMARGRLELMNKFKPMITQDTVMIREMQKPAYEQPNVFNILMFTNHEDAIIISEEDRRYCILFSPAKKREASYYSELWDWTQENIQAIFHHFKTRDLSNFKPLAHPPMTEGKRSVIAEGLSPIHAWMKECIELEAWPFMGDIVSINHLMSCLPQSIKWVTPQSLAKALKSCGARSLGQFKLVDGNAARLWSVRRHEIWAGAEPATLSAEYMKWSNKSEPGGNPMLEAKPM